MYRTLHYIGLLVILMLIQTFVFDNLAISVWFYPLIYVTFIVLLPIDTRPIMVLLTALAVGIIADYTTGGAGLNTSATLLVGFIRQPLLNRFCDNDDLRDGGIPSPQRMGGEWKFVRYAALIVFIHHLTLFLLESMSMTYLLHTLLRTLLSGGFTLLFVWISMRLFIFKISRV